MKRDYFKLSYYLFLSVASLLDAGYLAFLGVQIAQIKNGSTMLYPSFQPLTAAIIAGNAALAGYTILYLILRKK